jgi:hypothetical protein
MVQLRHSLPQTQLFLQSCSVSKVSFLCPHLPRSFCSGALRLIAVMVSDDLDIPQSAVLGVPDHSPSSFSPAIPSSLDGSRLPVSSRTDDRGLLRNSLDPLGSPTPPSNDPLPQVPFPPSPDSPGSITSCLWSNSTHDNDPGEHDAEDNPSPLHSAHSDVTSPFTVTHLHSTLDTGSRRPLAPVTTFLKRIMHRLRRPSPSSPSRGTDAGWDATRNNGQKGDDADVKCKGAESACHTENESPTSALRLPPDSTDSSCLKSTDSSLSRLSPPSSIIESSPFPPTPTDPVPAEPQGSQSRVLVGSERSSTHSSSQT